MWSDMRRFLYLSGESEKIMEENEESTMIKAEEVKSLASNPGERDCKTQMMIKQLKRI